MVYYNYRYYIPALGCWLTPDPFEECGGINLYAYCCNNALNRWDALGQIGIHFRWDFKDCVSDCMENWHIDWSGLSMAVTRLIGITEIVSKTGLEHRGFDTKRIQWFTTDFSRAMGKLKNFGFAVKKYFPSVGAKLIDASEYLRHNVGKISSVKVPRFCNNLFKVGVLYDSYVFLLCANRCCDKDGVRITIDW